MIKKSMPHYLICCSLLLLIGLSTSVGAQTARDNPPNDTKQSDVERPSGEVKPSISFDGPPPIPRAKPKVKIWTPEEIEKAGTICGKVLSKWKLEVKHLPPLMGFDGCGDPAPLLVSQIMIDIGEKSVPVKISPAATLNCKMTGKLAHWLTHHVQPATQDYFNTDISKIHNVSSYHCRKRYNALRGKMSEHAFANALDISAFSLADGTKITVLKNWEKEQPAESTDAPEPTPILQQTIKTTSAQAASSNSKIEPIKTPYKESAQSVFLKNILKGACANFSTVLGPRANAAHADHFHLDLGRNGRYQICE